MGYGVLCCGIHQLKSAHRQADRWLIIQLIYAAEVGWTALTAGSGSGGAGVTLHISGQSVAYGGGGGGGAGGHSQNGGGANGGSGIVIIRYRLSPPA